LEIIENGEHISNIFKLTWKVDCWDKENQQDYLYSTATSEAFKFRDEQLFQAEFKLWENSKSACQQQFTMRLLSYGHEKIGCSTEEVTCFISQDGSICAQQFPMKEKPTHNKNLLQLFMIREAYLTFSPLLSLPFLITFNVKLRSTVHNFINKMMDSTWSEQLWAAAVDREITDVEFLVGQEVFGAHRSLLSARSPVFAAMFASEMKEAKTGQVRIDDVDPATFQQFLKFLYAGMFECSSMNRDLFKVADKYGVETLMELCRPATQQVDTEDIIKTFLLF